MAIKRTKSGARRGSSKEAGGPKTVDAYLARVPEPARSTLEKMRAAIRSVVPREATEVISYKIPAFRHNGILIWYAAFADHVSLFPGASIVEVFKDDLASLTTRKGTIQFPLGEPLPIPLIKRIVRARVEQVQAKKRH